AMSIASLGHDVTAVDLSDEMLKKARCNAERLGYDIKFMQGDAENLLFYDSEFDFVVSKYVMWTLPNPDKFVKEACRVLSNGGIFCAIDNIWHNRTESLVIPEGQAYYYECYKDLKEELPLFYENSADKIIEITKRHGMSNEKIQYLNSYDMFLKNYDNQTHASEYPNPPYMVTAEKLC
ncbi:MAG TPA: class I SAM-dependent methyltransferase, partial [Methanocorpusculum sp.]|nr:class I SAM-dependent methyltransferase [Methanocorpusculum sp.]